MPPFTQGKQSQQNRTESLENSPTVSFNYEVSILAMAKKVHLSFEELNMLTMNDFMDFIDITLGDTEQVVEREANQNDIEKFYSNK